MPLDPGANVYAPPKKKRNQPAPVEGPHSVGPGETPLTRYRSQSLVPGIFPQSDVHQLNYQVEQITLAFQNRFGHQPSPGLVFDLLRAPIDPSEYDALFKAVPKTAMGARFAGPHSDLPDVAQAPGPHSQLDRQVPRQEDLSPAAAIPRVTGKPLEMGAVGGNVADFNKVRVAGDIVTKAVGQVAQSLVYSPLGILAASQAIGEDIFTTHDVGQFKHTRELGGQFARQIAQDFQHPEDNPGYLFLDILGAVSLGVGAAARAGAIGRLGEVSRAAAAGGDLQRLVSEFNLKPQTVQRVIAGQNARAVLSAALRRPLPGVATIGPKGAEEFKLLRENALFRAPQRWYYNRLNKLLASTEERNVIDRALYGGIFGPEKIVSRAARQRLLHEEQLLRAPVEDLAHAANTSVLAARAFQKLPRKLKRGLTIGEQMAIFVKATPRSNALELWRGWFEKMQQLGIGDPLAHAANLDRLKLAEEALANPSPNLVKALRLTEEVSNAQQALKTDHLGLSKDTAEARIEKMGAVLEEVQHAFTKEQVFQAVENVMNDNFLTRGANADLGYYYQHAHPRNTSRNSSRLVAEARSSKPYGVAMPDLNRRLPELSHRNEGDVILSGDIAIDAGKLVGGAYARTVRAMTVLEDWRRLNTLAYDKISDAPAWEREYLDPIRSARGVQDELKDLVAKVEQTEFLSSEDAQLLASKEFQNLNDYLFKPPEGDIENVRWVNRNYQHNLHLAPNEPSGAIKLLASLNDPFRFLSLYGKPSYALNIPGNVGMLMMQSTFSPARMARSLRAGKVYSERVIHGIDNLVGEGKALSYTPEDTRLGVGRLGRDYHQFTQGLAHMWSVFVDRWMRRASWLEEAYKRGYKTNDDMEKLFDLKNEVSRKNLFEITERSNKAMVQFDNLTPFEKNTMRHIIFVYPWVSRSAVWAIRTALDHPLKTWTASELGRIGEKKAAEFFSHGEVQDFEKWIAPDWFKRTGYIPVARTGNGSPIILNPNSINTFSTLNELYTQAHQAIFGGDPFTSALDMTGPGVQSLAHGFTGRNNYGDSYAGSPWWGALMDQIGTLPQARAATGGGSKIKSLEGAFMPYGPLILGGLWPKQADMQELADSYYKENPEASKQHTAEKAAAQRLVSAKIEIRMVRSAENVTAKVVGSSVPAEVRDAVNLNARFIMAFTQFANEHGRSPTTAERRTVQIKQLEQMGRITPSQAADLNSQLQKAIKSDSVDTFTKAFANQYLHRKEMMDWHDQRDAVLEVANNLGDQLDYLRKAGLWSGSNPASLFFDRRNLHSLPQTTGIPGGQEVAAKGGLGTASIFAKASAPIAYDSPQFQLARQYLDFNKKLNALKTPGSTDLESVSTARHRYWLDQQDKPVSINGEKFPSMVRLHWAVLMMNGTKNDPEYEAKQLARLSTQSWSTLSSFEKEVVGRKSSLDVSRGWVIWSAVTDALRGNVTPDDVAGFKIKGGNLGDIIPKALPQDQREVSKAYKIQLARYVDKNYAPGFYKDYLYSIEPKYRRLSLLPIINQSPARKEWVDLFQAANAEYGYIATARALEAKGRDPGYTITSVQNSWDDYTKNSLYPYFEQHASDAFKKELEMLGGVDFLRTLIADG